jgi:hypothetical protein
MKLHRRILIIVIIGLFSVVGTTSSTAGGATQRGVPLPSPVSCGSINLMGLANGTSASASATLGSVRATLSGAVELPSLGPSGLSEATITVYLDAKRVMKAALPTQEIEPGLGLIPGDFGRGNAPFPWAWVSSTTSVRALCIAHFGGPRPETAVLVNVYSGGAHCCTLIDAYRVTSNSSLIERDLGNPGASLISVGSHAVLVTADNAFAYQFASYGGSGMPLKTLELRGHSFVVTTREHLNWVAVDAGFQWGSYVQSQSGYGLGWLAAWAADECTLGQSAQLTSTLGQLQAQSMLDSTLAGWPSGSAYLDQLRSFLASHGYCQRKT